MKLLKAIVRSDRVDRVQEAVDHAGVPGMTATDVRGHGSRPSQTAVYRGQRYVVPFWPRVEIEVAASDDLYRQVLAAAVEAARTGAVGDGIAFVVPVIQSFRIRTGEAESL